MAQFKKGQVIGAQQKGFKGADINKLPGYSTKKTGLKAPPAKSLKKALGKALGKKGLQTNYSKL